MSKSTPHRVGPNLPSRGSSTRRDRNLGSRTLSPSGAVVREYSGPCGGVQEHCTFWKGPRPPEGSGSPQGGHLHCCLAGTLVGQLSQHTPGSGASRAPVDTAELVSGVRASVSGGSNRRVWPPSGTALGQPGPSPPTPEGGLLWDPASRVDASPHLPLLPTCS